LSFDAVVILDTEGERRIDIERLPLRVGTGSECELRLPGPGGGPVALLDLLDDAPFVQPVGGDGALRINGSPLTTSRRLVSGDNLEFFGSRIEIGTHDGTLTLAIRLEDSAYVTKPPELPDTAGGLEDETIAPTAFRRAAETAARPVEPRYRHWQRYVAGMLVLLAIASYLLFSARSVQFAIDPGEPDDVEIDGGWFKLPLGDRYLMRRGDYTVHVSKAGYYGLSQRLTVGDAQSQSFQLVLRKLPGQLSVITTPTVDAVVTIDEGIVGQAPYGPVELQPGTHTVAVSADRFLPFADVFEIPGLGRHEEIHVQLVPGWAEVAVSTVPAGATVYEGERRLGETPVRLELLEGTHDISVVLDGYKAWDGTVIAEPNVSQEVPTIRLEPANARLLVKTIPRGANVTVNGRYRGQSPVNLSLSPDINYEIGMSKAGYGVASRRIRLEAAASEEITVDLTARTGRVTVRSYPSDATVYVDGRARGTGTVTLNLSAAPHRIEVRREGYESVSRSITPRPGYPQTVQIRLRSNEEIRRASVALTVTTSEDQVLRRVEPGSFVMGASRSEQGRRANEVLVPVTLTKPFFIGAKEVTNKEFARFRQGHDSGADVHASLAGDLNPVANLTWSDAVEYCNWLSAKEGLQPAYEKKFDVWIPIYPVPNGYRLPSEAEWAWAIRYAGSGKPSRFPWGEKLPPRGEAGNYADKSASGIVPTILPSYDDGYASTAPVGSFPANALGIHDGGGNVAEWVNDLYTVPTPGQTKAVIDPVGPERGTHHVIRGSSWRHAGVTELRLSYRDFGTDPRTDVGFRLARNVEQ
jgi:formylglycine-generating enzyme required for sulfatase activity